MSWDATTGDFFEALAEAAARGVKVLLLFDHIGTYRVPGYRGMIKNCSRPQSSSTRCCRSSH